MATTEKQEQTNKTKYPFILRSIQSKMKDGQRTNYFKHFKNISAARLKIANQKNEPNDERRQRVERARQAMNVTDL